MGSLDQLGFSFRPPERRVWTVRDLIVAIRDQLEREHGDIWLEGEISNFRAHPSGHLYFTLKDESSQVRVVMFRTQARLLRFKPEDGMRVVARGRVTVYETRGELQINAEYLEPQGAGALQIAFEQLKAKLQAEGLFEQDRKKPIPSFPRRIGIVTSPQAAALRDILHILRRRHHSANVLIFPAQVQGDAAPIEVSTGIRYFNKSRDVDVIIVARGGGSVEDLAAFNHEGLARAVSTSTIPVISAIGHETDFTIIDFVADLRAPTPSAAAELVILSRQEIEEQSEGLRQRLDRAMRYRLLMARQALLQVAQHGAFARMMDSLGRRQQRIDDLVYRLEKAERRTIDVQRRRWEIAAAAVRHYDANRRLAAMREQLQSRTAALASVFQTVLLQRRSRLERLTGELKALSPLAILNRGYALVFDSSGRLIKDATRVAAGDEISAKIANGIIDALVKGTRK